MANVNIKEKLNQGWIRFIAVIEVLGKPAEYLDEVIRKVIEHLEKAENVHVISKKFYEPKPIDKVFTTFTEVEIIVKDLKILFDFINEYMPSNIEIIEPNELKLDMHSANDFVNMLSAKIHQYDAVAKRLTLENKILKNKLEKLGELPEEVKEAEKILKDKK